jgi:hypothetical protein
MSQTGHLAREAGSGIASAKPVKKIFIFSGATMKTAVLAFAILSMFASISGATVLKCHSVVSTKAGLQGGDHFILDTSKQGKLVIPVVDGLGCSISAYNTLVTMQVGKLFEYKGELSMLEPMARSETHGAILSSSDVTAYPKPGLSIMCICYEMTN